MDRVDVDPGRGRGRRVRLRRHDRPAGRRHRAHVLARRRPARRGAGHDRRPPVRLVAAGGALRRAGGDVRHDRPRRRGRRAEHERDPDQRRRCSPASSSASTTRSRGSPGWDARYGTQEVSQFRGAEMIAEKWDISREDMEAFAVESHRARARGAATRAASTARSCRSPASTHDEGPREPDLDKIRSLPHARRGRPAHRRGVVTDLRRVGRDADRERGRGAGRTASRRGPASTTSRVRGADPVWMLTAPIPATAYALEKTGMTLDDIDLVEINEAFASVVLAWQKETGRRPRQGQRQRRRDRARPSARRHRRAADDDAAARARAHRRPLRPADDVRRRRPGQRHHHRTPVNRRVFRQKSLYGARS